MYVYIYIHTHTYKYVCFPGVVSGKKKNLPASAGDIRDVDSVSGSGRFPRKGNEYSSSILD